MDFKSVLAILGFILIIVGGLMATALPFSFEPGVKDGEALLISMAVTITAGCCLWFPFRGAQRILGKREGFVIVALGWVVASLFGCLPYMISGAIPSFTDAYFETMSGFTTTGSSVLSDIEAVPRGILFWRSMTQWIGGVGIVLLSVAILPLLGVGGMQLFSAEASGLSVEKLTPRISQTARILWFVYITLTAMETILLLLGGMSLFDALNHSLTTVASGGFSTRNNSIAAFPSPFIQYTIILFMFLAGVNFALHIKVIRGDRLSYFRDGEFLGYLGFASTATAIIFSVTVAVLPAGVEESFRAALFQVVSLLSSTGYASADFELWPAALQLILLSLMLSCGSAGSTSGGIKVIRVLLLVKSSLNEIRKLVHPRAIFPVRYNGRSLGPDITASIHAFIVLYIAIFLLSSILLTFLGMDIVSAASAVITALGNVGPGLGTVGPIDNFAHIPDMGKWLLSFCMLAGRLELFTVLVLFAPSFWKH